MIPFCSAYISFMPAAQAIFWFTGAVLFYVYLGYPIVLAAVSAFCERRKHQPGYCPTISIIIPAYNEEAQIGRKLAETVALEYPMEKCEVVVVSDGSTDRTESIVSACKDPRVRLLRVDQRKGKTHAQNVGVEQCQGEVVVFSDATTVYDPKALLYLACNYEDPQVGAVSGIYRYVAPAGKSPTELGSVTFWNYENLIKRLQSTTGTLTGCSGCIYSLRRRLYTPLADSACSDLVEPLHIVRQGYRVLLEDRAIAYEETTKSAKDEFRMRVRVATHGIGGVLALMELLKIWKYGWISFQLISHKLLRWLVPFFLILLLFSSAALRDQVVFRYLFLIQVLFYAFSAASLLCPLYKRWKPLGLPLYFCTLNLAALVSFFELFRGRRYVVWDTVRR